jgi:hypothetical protein
VETVLLINVFIIEIHSSKNAVIPEKPQEIMLCKEESKEYICKIIGEKILLLFLFFSCAETREQR